MLTDKQLTDQGVREYAMNPMISFKKFLFKDWFKILKHGMEVTDSMNEFRSTSVAIEDTTHDYDGVTLPMVWNIMCSNKTLPLAAWKIVYDFIKCGIWLMSAVQEQKLLYVDESSVIDAKSRRFDRGIYTAAGTSYQGPEALFCDGVKSYWTTWSFRSNPERATVFWNFYDCVTIYCVKIIAENYSNYIHFAREIQLSCGMDHKHEKYDHSIKLITEQNGKWNYFYGKDTNNNTILSLRGKYWKLQIIHLHNDKSYAEIAQVDFKGYIAR
eukprot:32161_1